MKLLLTAEPSRLLTYMCKCLSVCSSHICIVACYPFSTLSPTARAEPVHVGGIHQ